MPFVTFETNYTSEQRLNNFVGYLLGKNPQLLQNTKHYVMHTKSRLKNDLLWVCYRTLFKSRRWC